MAEILLSTIAEAIEKHLCLSDGDNPTSRRISELDSFNENPPQAMQHNVSKPALKLQGLEINLVLTTPPKPSLRDKHNPRIVCTRCHCRNHKANVCRKQTSKIPNFSKTTSYNADKRCSRCNIIGHSAKLCAIPWRQIKCKRRQVTLP